MDKAVNCSNCAKAHAYHQHIFKFKIDYYFLDCMHFSRCHLAFKYSNVFICLLAHPYYIRSHVIVYSTIES